MTTDFLSHFPAAERVVKRVQGMLRRTPAAPSLPTPASSLEATVGLAAIPNPFLPERPVIPESMITEAFTYQPLTQSSESCSDLSRSLLREDGTPLLLAPNPTLVDQLHAQDERITAFYPDWPNGDKLGHIRNVGEPEYFSLVSTPVAKSLAESFGMSVEEFQKRYLLRGIGCSINGPIHSASENVLIRDIRHIVDLGDEQGRSATRVGGLLLDEGEPQLHHRVSQYLSYADLLHLRLGEKSPREEIFPALLVLDRSLLQPDQQYWMKLPDSPGERRKVVARAIILPRPVN